MVLKIFLMILNKTKGLPEEERKIVLKELDEAIGKATDKDSNKQNTSDLEKWVGIRL